MIDKNTLLFENLLYKLEKKIPFLGMNPLNEASQKKKFLKIPGYNPLFSYKKHSYKCEGIYNKIERIELENTALNKLLLQKLEKYKKTDAMIKNIGKEEFTFFSRSVHGKPTRELVKKAYKILEKEASQEENVITSKQVCEVIRKVLDEFGLQDWSVGMKNMAANASVKISMKMVNVKKNAKFPISFLKRVVVHEIGTHVFRSANGERQPNKTFRSGLPNYLMTEEGMAVNAEEMNGVLKINTLRIYAGRVIAVHLSLQKGFREVFDELRKYFDDSTAWKITLRAKRGLLDQSKPGAYTKDYLYLHGFYEVGKYLKEHGEQGLSDLYIGRIGLEHIPLIKKIPGLKKPELVPNSEKFRRIVEELSA